MNCNTKKSVTVTIRTNTSLKISALLAEICTTREVLIWHFGTEHAVLLVRTHLQACVFYTWRRDLHCKGSGIENNTPGNTNRINNKLNQTRRRLWSAVLEAETYIIATYTIRINYSSGQLNFFVSIRLLWSLCTHTHTHSICFPHSKMYWLPVWHLLKAVERE